MDITKTYSLPAEPRDWVTNRTDLTKVKEKLTILKGTIKQ
jgi:hypothetical protein